MPISPLHFASSRDQRGGGLGGQSSQEEINECRRRFPAFDNDVGAAVREYKNISWARIPAKWFLLDRE